jgi:osmoprotectant transport system permease protein
VIAAPLLAALLAGATSAPGGPPIRVGSKEFTESVILGELAARLLEDGGLPAEHRRALGGTRVLWEALLAGEIDVYPEYTGTIAREILSQEAPQGPEALARAGASWLAAALEARGLAATASLGFEDGYAVGVRRELAARLGLARLSDLARHPELRLGFTNEFMDRGDGWPLLRARYGLPQKDVRGLQHDLAYRALAAGEIDATDLYSTDPEIRRLDLVVLADDRRVFPEYAAIFVYRKELAARAPAAVAALRRLEGRISAQEMIALNARAQLERVPEAEVAAAFARATLGVDARAEVQGWPARVWGRTREHLALVGIALAAAIAVALPLGVLAARRPVLGRGVLALAGVVQTIPSLALLVLLLPLLGIGARPAIAALFLYSLLPILRNTHAGLVGIAPELRDAAASLPLSPWARLRLVELPLAAPAILAGVKTSAVIAVGTATLGALVGAGGYGQPILTGIRLVSWPLLLEGAVPAAVLAILVQGAFDLLERWIVRWPRG